MSSLQRLWETPRLCDWGCLCQFCKECAVLVLSRKKNETIVVGDELRITILDIRGDKIRIGVDAPRDVSVHREEVYNAIQREAARVQPVS